MANMVCKYTSFYLKTVHLPAHTAYVLKAELDRPSTAQHVCPRIHEHELPSKLNPITN
jgi:hypothetical protein